VDIDQKDVNPSVIASALKKVDVVTYDAIASEVDGTFPGGHTASYGLMEDGVGYQLDNLTSPPCRRMS
jgi:basic membrane lipoprotein Med (substrate-binding protein (PBP1-ABC) superfamily)